MTPDRSLDHLYPAFSKKIRTILLQMDRWCAVHLPGYHAQVAEGYRGVRRQQELYAQGRTTPGDIVTEKDGVKNRSRHQGCLAADVAFARLGLLTWDVPEAAWEYLRHLAHTQGLTSGSDWKAFKDRPHLEWPASDRDTYEAAEKWKAAMGLA